MNYTLTDISKDVNVKEYTIDVTPTANANGNYTITPVSGKLTITPKPLDPATPNTPDNPAKPDNPSDNDPLSTSLVIKGATKVYNGDASTDPTTYTVVGPTGYTDFVVPALTADDFDLSGINSQNVGKYVVKLSAAGITKIQNANTNYSFTAADIQSGLFVITPAPITITAPTVSKDYDGKPYGTITGTVSGKPAKGVAVSYTLTDISQIVKAGHYDINVTNGTNPNYTVTLAKGSLTINPVAATFKLTGTDDKTYDGQTVNVNDVKSHYTVTLSNGDKYTLQDGDLAFNTAVTDVDNYTVVLTQAGKDHVKAADANYVFTDDGSDATYIVNKRDVTITAQDNGKTFGTTDPSLSGTVELFNEGNNSGLVKGDTLTYTVDRVTGENVGRYAINVNPDTNKNYNVKVVPANFTITPAKATYKLDGDAHKVYDGKSTDINTVTGSYTITLNNGKSYTAVDGDLAFDKDAKNVGDYTVKLTDAGIVHVKAVDSNYDYSEATGKATYEITPKPLDPATPNEPGKPANPGNPSDNNPLNTSIVIKGATKVYDGDKTTDPTTYTVVGPTDYKGFVVPTLTAGDFDLTGINSQNVGNYTVKLSAAGIKKIQDANKNYSFDASDIQSGLFVITPAPITITAPTATKVYDGKPFSGLTGTITGQPAKGDTVTYTFTNADNANVGEYAIGVTSTQNANYTITTVPGKLTITPAEATYKLIGNTEKTYDGQATNVNDVKGHYTVTLSNGNTYQVTDGDLTFSFGNEVKNAGHYVVSLTTAAKDRIAKSDANYTFTDAGEDASYTINKRPATITAASNSKVAGTSDPVLTATTEGFVNGDMVHYNVDRAPGEEVGTYLIEVNNVGQNDNYDITAKTGVFTITATVPKEATFKLTGTDSKTYDGKVVNANDVKAAYRVTLSNGNTYTLQNGDLIFNQDVKNVGHYTVKLTQAAINKITADANYTFTDEGSTATYDVNKKLVKIIVNDNHKVQGTTDPDLTASVAGVVPGDSLDYTVSRKPGEAVGKYAITATYTDNDNYTVEVTDGTFEITPTPIHAGAVNVHYIVAGTGKELRPMIRLEGEVGTDYTVDQMNFKGYTLKEIVGGKTGEFSNETGNVILRYTVDYTAVPVTPDGKHIPNVPPVTGTGIPGEPIEMPNIPGYNRIEVPKVPNDPGEVTVVYVPIEGTVIVHYRIDGTDGKTIHPDQRLTGRINTDFNVDQLNIPGYTFSRSDKLLTGSFVENQVNEITLYYTVNYTVVPKTPDGHTIPNVPTIPGTGIPGEPITNIPDIPGYRRVTTVVPNVPGEPGQVTVVYVKIPNEPQPPVVPGKPETPTPGTETPGHETPTPGTNTPAPHVPGAQTPTPVPGQPGKAYVPATGQRGKTAKELPHTGEEDQSVTAGIGLTLMASLLGLIGFKRRKKHDEEN
ncbi:LPXTG-motif protein cell wall anchor domain protein [Furfurilactobacillus siliginis]|uniref:LPXTG-motif protein cell wall anchor domain protein n=1 Tax=Furfurilactobacillus siliginis TaxID=348151 RepID=A0A0R2L3J4_9LACO|nr:LPXTG-motif protein cell wall anchor domain protein [Furfurilactobacillus siliginis]